MKRPKKKEQPKGECNCFATSENECGCGKFPSPRVAGFNECHDLDTKYIEELKEKIEILMKRLDDDFRKPSVEEIQYVLMKYLPYKKHETQVAKAIDRLNKEG